MTLCNTCIKANKTCIVYPLDTNNCVEYAPSNDVAFEEWLRTVCFQKPTKEAYDLAKCAWNEALKTGVAK